MPNDDYLCGNCMYRDDGCCNDPPMYCKGFIEGEPLDCPEEHPDAR
jgi:hypothetical protein